MKLLNRYILLQFIKFLCLVTLGFLCIYLLIDFFEKIDNFKDAGKSFSLLAHYSLLNLPAIANQLSPVLLLLSGIITIGIINQNNELIAFKSCGVPLKQVIKPVIAGSLGVIILLLALNQWVLPITIPQTNKIWYKDVQGMVPLGTYRDGRYYYKGVEGFYSFERKDNTSYFFENFSYSRINSQNNLQELISAEKAVWKNNMWLLTNGQIQKQNNNNNFITKFFTKTAYDLPDSPADFFIPENYTAELSLTDLIIEANKSKIKTDRDNLWLNFLQRLSYILLGLPLLYLGLPSMLFCSDKWGYNLSVSIPASCVLAFIVWGIWGAMQSFAMAGYIHPLLAATSIHLFFGGFGFYLLTRQDNIR